MDRLQRGKISLESLQEVLSAALETDLTTDDKAWNKLLDIVDPVSLSLPLILVLILEINDVQSRFVNVIINCNATMLYISKIARKTPYIKINSL